MTEEKIVHLQFIQNIIDRMSRNSFQLKELCVTIVAALLALYVSSGNSRYIFVAVTPAIVFALLDAYYLLMERRFRGIYNDIIIDSGIIKPFDMPVHLYQGTRYSYVKVILSRTIFWFYLPIILTLILCGIILPSS